MSAADYSQLPEAMLSAKRWLVWKLRKVPFYITGAPRSGALDTPKDREQLAVFADALRALSTGKYTGLGFALGDDGTGKHWQGIDIDKLPDHPELNCIAETMPGYTETSPSGTGLHAIGYGRFSRAMGSNGTGIEGYTAGRYFTVTGSKIGEGVPICLADYMENVLRPMHGSTSSKPAHAESTVQLAPVVEVSQKELAKIKTALLQMRADDRDLWVRNGHRLKALGEIGRGLWLEWSATSDKFDSADASEKWETFKPTNTGYSAIFDDARAGGWFYADDFEVIEAPAGVPALPKFTRDNHGAIEATKENVTTALHCPDICGYQIRHDTFRDEVMLSAPKVDEWRVFRDSDYHELCMVLERGATGFKNIQKELIRDAVLYVAERNAFDSAQRWLESLVWDGVPRVENFLRDCFGTADTPYTRAVGRYFWTAITGRILEPGLKADMVPVAVGAQGIMKSSAVAAIAPAVEHFLELDLSNKDEDIARLLRGKVVVELGELKGLRAREAEHVKSLISRTHENWIPKYREMSVTYARRCLFFGTTNKDEFLADDTGHRRWLPFNATKCDPNAVKRDRDQLWAEGRELFRSKGVLWSDAERLANAEHAAFVVVDAWEELIETWATTPCELSGKTPGGTPFTAVEALTLGVGMAKATINQGHKDRMARVLKALGYSQKRTSKARTYIRDSV